MTLGEGMKVERDRKLLAALLSSIGLRSGMGAEGWGPCLQSEADLGL